MPGTPLMCQGPPRGARDPPEVPGTPVSPGREVPAWHGAAAPPPSLRLLLFPAELQARGAFQAEPIPNISPESICKGKSSVLAPWPHPGLAAWVCKSSPRGPHFITKHKGRGGVGWPLAGCGQVWKLAEKFSWGSELQLTGAIRKTPPCPFSS